MGTEERKPIKRVSFVFLQKLSAGVSLLALLVTVISGMMGGAHLVTITMRAAVAIVVIGVVTRIVIKVLESYEEMNSGKG